MLWLASSHMRLASGTSEISVQFILDSVAVHVMDCLAPAEIEGVTSPLTQSEIMPGCEVPLLTTSVAIWSLIFNRGERYPVAQH